MRYVFLLEMQENINWASKWTLLIIFESLRTAQQNDYGKEQQYLCMTEARGLFWGLWPDGLKNYVRDIQTSMILITGKCFVSYSFGILEVQRGKDKTPRTHGSFQNSTQRIKYTVQRPHQAHSAPKRALSQRRLPSLVKKQQKRHFSYQ